MLQLQDQDIAYGEKVVIHKLSLKIEAGEKVAFIGPSGAGKTTLLHNLRNQAGVQSSFVHQDLALVPQLSVFHNVFSGRLDQHSLYYNLRNLIWPANKALADITPLLDELGLKEKVKVPVAQLSGGQKQRVAIARALYRNSPIVIADEPVSSLDPHRASSVLKLLLNGQHMLLSSLHSVDLALAHFERIVGMRGGTVFFDLPASDVTQFQLDELFQSC